MNGGMPEPQLAAGTIVQEDCAEQYRPSRSECLRDYQVGIKFLSIGCIISVGCKEIPFTTVKEGMEALNAYVKANKTDIVDVLTAGNSNLVSSLSDILNLFNTLKSSLKSKKTRSCIHFRRLFHRIHKIKT